MSPKLPNSFDINYYYNYTRLPRNGLFSRTTWVSWYQNGKTSLDLNEATDDGVWGRQWHQLDRMQKICTSLQIDNHINNSTLNCYRPDALPDDQPTVSNHWRHQHARKLYTFDTREVLIPVTSLYSHCLKMTCMLTSKQINYLWFTSPHVTYNTANENA